jgi:hypothetical protein
MGLDDFRGDTGLSDEHKDRLDRLSQHEPPSDADTWSMHEPGTPSWLEFIKGTQANGEAIVKIAGADSTELKSDVWFDLEECR